MLIFRSITQTILLLCIVLFKGAQAQGDINVTYTTVLEIIGIPSLLDEAQTTLIADTFTAAYNNAELSAQIIGTPTFNRQVIGAQVLDLTNTSATNLFTDTLNITQFYTLILQVKTSCDTCTSNLSLFSNETSSRFFFSHCPWFGANNGVVAYKFNQLMIASNLNLPAVDFLYDLQELEPIAPCSTNVVTVDTDVVVDFIGNQSIATEAELNALADTFKDTYNFYNGINADTCDPFFRQITEVTIDLNTTKSRRYLQKHQRAGRSLQDTSSLSDLFSFFFRVKFICRDCPSSTGLFTNSEAVAVADTARRLNLDGEPEEYHKNFDAYRFLQTSTFLAGNQCVCPINADATRSPTVDEFTLALASTIGIVSAENQINFIAAVDGALEVLQVPCSNQINTKQRNVILEAKGAEPDAVEDEGSILEAAFVGSYNKVAQSSCNPGFNTVSAATLVSVETDTTERRNLKGLQIKLTTPLKMTLRISFRCRCKNKDEKELFGNDAVGSGKPRELTVVSGEQFDFEQSDEHHYNRRVQQNDACFCDTDSVNNTALPSVQAFLDEYNIRLREAEVKTVAEIESAVEVPTPVTWEQVGGDIIGEAADDESGTSVAMSADGTVVAIGSMLNDGNGDRSGHVRVFELSGISWIQRGGDIDGEIIGDRSGESVALSANGSILVIGSPRNGGNDGFGCEGQGRVFQWTGSVWSQLGSDIDGIPFTSSGTQERADRNGRSVSLSSDGTIMAISSNKNDYGGEDSGFVRVFDFSDGDWQQRGQDILGQADFDESGRSISISGDGSLVAIGAPGNDGGGQDAGHVRVYEWNGSAWVQYGSNINGESAADQSGWSVSLSTDGLVLAIGARFNTANPDFFVPGHVRVYEFTGDWTQRGVDLDGTNRDEFGTSVSMSSDGSVVAVGAPETSEDASEPNNRGYVRMYKWTEGSWVQEGLDIVATGLGDRFGTSVALSSDGSMVAVGSVFADKSSEENNNGLVRVYRTSK